MIQEIIRFVEYLEENDQKSGSNIFSEGSKLKEGLYIFLEKEGDGLVIKDGNILNVDKNGMPIGNSNNKTEIYNEFLKRYLNVAPITSNKAFNRKLFGLTANPFAIGFKMTHFLDKDKHNPQTVENSLKEYFKNSKKYIHIDMKCTIEEFNDYLLRDLWRFLITNEYVKALNKTASIYIFIKNEINDFMAPYIKYKELKVFNKEAFNITAKNDVLGISDNLSGFASKKVFLKHQSAPFDLNYRISGASVLKIHKFFNLVNDGFIPNPMMIFVDKNELDLSKQIITFYNSQKTKRFGYKEMVKIILQENNELQKFYLLYFNFIPKKGRKIIDIDFVPIFRYEFEKKMKILSLFKIEKEGGSGDYYIETVFDFEEILHEKIFLQYRRNSKQSSGILKNNYFSEEIKPLKGSGISPVTVLLLYKYRKAIYDFVYKSKHHLITTAIFHDIIKSLVLDDIRHDTYDAKYKSHSKEESIKEKLNIWFSLYSYFNNNNFNQNNIDMANNIEKHRQLIIDVAERKQNIRDNDDEGFAFVAGQVIYYLLSKSKSSDKSYSKLEPFLQKNNYLEFRKVLKNTFYAYKHENFSRKFSNPFANIMDYVPEKSFKELLPTILAGFFSNNELFANTEDYKNN